MPLKKRSRRYRAQRPYPTRGRLLVFNGKSKGKPSLLAQIYTTNPFAARLARAA